MQTLARALARNVVAGAPLPSVYPSLELAEIRPRRGQVVMVAGAPNAGKSALGIAWVRGMGVPTLVFSADTDQYTTALRVAAMETGYSMQLLEQQVQQQGRHILGDYTEDLDHLVFCFDPSPSLHDIDQEVRAFTEVWGAPPQVVMVDNLMNVLVEEGDEFRGLRVAMAELHDLARRTDACVFVLHHVSGEYDGTPDPPPRRAVHGKITQLPELIVTVANRGTHMGIAPVKNRTGHADPDAKVVVWLGFDPQRMLLTDFKDVAP